MIPTDRYTQWIALLAASDANLVALAALAIGAVIVWRLIGRAPAPWSARLALSFQVASAGLVLELVSGLHPTPVYLVLLGFALLTAGTVLRYYGVGRTQPPMLEHEAGR